MTDKNQPWKVKPLTPAECAINIILTKENMWTESIFKMLVKLRTVRGREDWRYRDVSSAQISLLIKRIPRPKVFKLDRGGASQLISCIFNNK